MKYLLIDGFTPIEQPDGVYARVLGRFNGKLSELPVGLGMPVVEDEGAAKHIKMIDGRECLHVLDRRGNTIT